MELSSNFFGAFIMTFERPEIILKTIRDLRSQTFPPEYILIVDNSESFDTQDVLKNLLSPSLEYHRVGYNSGPAGAARVGLSKVSEKGFQWIYWGDDDNPPGNPQVFEYFFERIKKLEKLNVNLGIYGGKGGNINKLTGRIRSLQNRDLLNKETVEVDMVAGGQTMLVKSSVIGKCILPEERLFFGFEELDFCLKVKASGFKIYADAFSWYKIRLSAGNNSLKYRPVGSSFGNEERLIRDYYSTRNFISILKKHRLYLPLSFQLVKSMTKMFLGFKFGTSYGRKNLFLQMKAVRDFLKDDFSFKEIPTKSWKEFQN